MRFMTSLTVLTGLLGIATATPFGLSERQTEVCYASGSNFTQVIISVQAVVYPVLVNDFAGGTVIYINGVAYSINNGPTIISATSTETVTSTVTTTVAANTVIAPLPPFNSDIAFVLGFAPVPIAKRGAAQPQVSKRQGTSTQNNTGFVGAQGASVSTCEVATAFNIVNGELFSTNGQVSTNTGVTSQSFTLSTVVGNIATTFFGPDIVWINPAFTGGQALFCLMDGVLFVQFTGIYPVGCEPVTLTAVPMSSCLAITSPSSTLTPASSSVSSGTGASSVFSNNSASSGTGTSSVFSSSSSFRTGSSSFPTSSSSLFTSGSSLLSINNSILSSTSLITSGTDTTTSATSSSTLPDPASTSTSVSTTTSSSGSSSFSTSISSSATSSSIFATTTTTLTSTTSTTSSTFTTSTASSTTTTSGTTSSTAILSTTMLTTTTQTTTSTTTTTTAAPYILPQACTNLSNFNGLALIVQVPLCATAIGSNSNPAEQACLNTAVINIFTQGTDIVNCLMLAYQ